MICYDALAMNQEKNIIIHVLADEPISPASLSVQSAPLLRRDAGPFIGEHIMKELWKLAQEYSDYQVSNLGRVRQRGTRALVESTVDQDDGQYGVRLLKDRKIHRVQVQHLVACAFLGPMPENHHLARCTPNKADNWSSNFYYQETGE